MSVACSLDWFHPAGFKEFEAVMTTERDRVISITLSEAEWRAFVTRHPQPVDWLRERIRNEVQQPAPEPTGDRQVAKAIHNMQ
jgi:hypothetical protein